MSTDCIKQALGAKARRQGKRGPVAHTNTHITRTHVLAASTASSAIMASRECFGYICTRMNQARMQLSCLWPYFECGGGTIRRQQATNKAVLLSYMALSLHISGTAMDALAGSGCLVYPVLLFVLLLLLLTLLWSCWY